VILAALGLAIVLGAGSTLAQTGAPSAGAPSVGDISRSLAPKSRGLPTLGDMPPAPANPAITPTATGSAAPRPSARRRAQAAGYEAHPSATLHTIQFRFGSAQLTPGSLETLKNLGTALNHELSNQPHFSIEGHTDAYGKPALNEVLSQARAEAVKDYLVKEMGVADARLQAVGKGSSEPVAGATPYSPINRRVVVVNLEH